MNDNRREDTTVTTTSAAARMCLIEVAADRSWAPEYQAYVGAMISNIATTAIAAGWEVTRLAADDLGTEELLAATAHADALVLTGGEDIDPSFYGGDAGYEGEGRHFPRADSAQIQVVRRAAREGTPVLGICRGHQIINVALGGDLIQHIDATGHRNDDLPIEYTLTEHPVLLDPSSRIAAVLGGEYVPVQSAHHQVVGRLGTGLRVVGWAHDGEPEAIEHESLPITGVQWHPEAPGAVAGQLASLISGLGSRVAVPAPR